jgi:4-hydroxy-2-oxoheptanedioate aldolase
MGILGWGDFMRTNKVKARMRAGKKAFGCQLVFPSATLIELMGYAGFDYVFLDGEHGVFTLKDIEENRVKSS